MASTTFGTVTLKTSKGEEFKVNGQKLKHYLGGKIIEDEFQVLSQRIILLKQENHSSKSS